MKGESNIFLILHPSAEFSIWTREAGAGGLSIAVEGPSKAEIAFEDRKDGSSGVSYIVQEPGERVTKSCLIGLNHTVLGFLMTTNIITVSDEYWLMFYDLLCRRL